MIQAKVYLVFWLTMQWMVSGPVAAALSYVLFFSDAHGLPAGNFGFVVAIFAISTVGYVLALRVLLSSQDRS